MSKIRVTTFEFPKVFSDLVLHELDPRYSRESVTIAANAGALAFGAVLTRKSDGTHAAMQETADTLDDAKAVLISPVEASDVEQEAVALRGYCIINAANLVFDDSVTQKQTALAALRDLGFIVREVSDADA